MKKLIVVTIALFASTLVMAQEKKEKPSAEERAEKRTEKMAKDLELSEEQKDKVYELVLNSIKERDQVREENKALKEERREKKKAEIEEFDAEMKSILTDGQAEVWEAKKAERKGKHDERRGKKGPRGPRGEHHESDHDEE